MLDTLIEAQAGTVPVRPTTPARLKRWLAGATPPRATAAERAWVAASGFAARPGSVCLLPAKDGSLAGVLFGADAHDPWVWASLPAALPAGRYHLEGGLDAATAAWAALGWALASYRFDRYRKPSERAVPLLAWPKGADRAQVRRTLAAIALVRDLVNTPAADLGPAELAEAAESLAHRHGASVRTTVGEALPAGGFPAVHAVGQAAARAPRVIDMVWGDPGAPAVTLVGKGVCFDSGGLDIKPSAAMKLMKKDMGGAAHVLALAGMIMDAGLRLRLRVLVPAVENAVGGNALHPLDVIRMANGTSVEVGNTDAEGRLILADCLIAAGRERPDLLLDIATLTGAARTALGPELPALFTPDDTLAAEIEAAALVERDPLWRLPLWRPYRGMLDSKVADISSASDSPFAGAVTAALFLAEFVPARIPWAHLDVYAWNPASRPGRPEGGEAMGLRALYRAITARCRS